MPKFTQAAIPKKVKAKKKKAAKKGIAQDVVDSYKPFVEQLEKNSIGTLTFGAGENIALGRKALVEAGIQLKKYIKVRKPRGGANILQIERITAKEFNAAKAKAKARAAKLKDAPRKKAAAPKKAAAKKKAPAKKKAAKKK